MDKIILKGVRLFGHIGVFDHEKENGQEFILNITIYADLSDAARTDRLDRTVNYGEVFDRAKTLMDTARYDLVETYAEQLARSIFDEHPLAQRVVVSIEKPNAPIDGSFESVGIEIDRERDD